MKDLIRCEECKSYIDKVLVLDNGKIINEKFCIELEDFDYRTETENVMFGCPK